MVRLYYNNDADSDAGFSRTSILSKSGAAYVMNFYPVLSRGSVHYLDGGNRDPKTEHAHVPP